MNKFLIEKKSLTGLTAWLNENFEKATKSKFTTNDVQKYIIRGHLPVYLGENKIVRDRSIEDVKLYNVKDHA